MIETLIQYFESHISLTEDEKVFLQNSVEIKHVGKSYLLLSEGEVSNAFFFVIKGGVRLFYTNDAEEKTAFFYFENTFVSAYESFTKQVPAKQNFQTIEDSTVAIITIDLAYRLIELFPKFEFLARVMMEEELIIYQKIISSFVMHSPEERYLRLLKLNSPFSNEYLSINWQHTLAVTAETLSRIRKELFQKIFLDIRQ